MRRKPGMYVEGEESEDLSDEERKEEEKNAGSPGLMGSV